MRDRARSAKVVPMEPETVSEGRPSTGPARAAAILALLLFGVASAVEAQSRDLSGPPIELGFLAISPPHAGGVMPKYATVSAGLLLKTLE